MVQETFVRLWKGLPGFRAESGIKTWVYRVTLNTAREHWRSQGRRKAAMARYAAQPRAASVEPAQADLHLRGTLAAALMELSWEQREAATLCYLEELSLAEAAHACGVPEGTIKSRLHHARLQLKESLR